MTARTDRRVDADGLESRVKAVYEEVALDLGSGSGTDTFLAALATGPDGAVRARVQRVYARHVAIVGQMTATTLSGIVSLLSPR